MDKNGNPKQMKRLKKINISHYSLKSDLDFNKHFKIRLISKMVMIMIIQSNKRLNRMIREKQMIITIIMDVVHRPNTNTTTRF